MEQENAQQSLSEREESTRLTINLNVNNKKQVDVDELNQILKQLQDKSNPSKTTITICFNEDVEFINIVFIAGLFLYYQIHETSFLLRMNKGKYAFKRETIHERRIREVQQYIEQTIKIYKVSASWINLFNETINLSKPDLTVSAEFVPILYIDEKSHKQLFEKSSNEDDSNSLGSITDYAINQLSEKYVEKITSVIKDSGVGRAYLQYCEAQHYKSIITLLKADSPIISIVFYLFLKKISYIGNIRTNSAGVLKDEDAEVIIRRFDELLSFTNDYVIGLNELSKNIIDHCSSKKGIITIRAYLNEDESNEKKIDTYVFDFGEKGVIPTLLDNTRMNERIINDEALKKDYGEDLVTLENDFTFESFIIPTDNKILNQQVRRSIAHYGLFQFFYLIENHQGYAHASSIDTNKNRDNFYYPGAEKHDERTINYGTSYFFSFPAPSIQNVSTKESKTKQEKFDSQQSSVDLVDDILEITTFNIVHNPSRINNSEITIYIEFSEADITITDRTSELEYYAKHISKYETLNVSHSSYLVIDLTNVTLAPSQLLRLLFKVNLNVKLPIIVYNIDSSTLINMIELNKKQFLLFNILSKNYHYWIKDKAFLAYSRCISQNGMFIFADLLYGLTSYEYIYTNRIISNTHPNLATIMNNIPQQKDEVNQHPNFSTVPLSAFFSNSSLRPFDILPFDDKAPLFVQNLEYLLNKEIENGSSL